jgi:DNA-binding NarL/FixJ family response regulator
MVRILIADDHELVRSGLRRLIEARKDWRVVAEASDGKEAISKALETKPDVAVLDHAMPIINGLEATRQVRAHLPDTEVLICTVHEDEMLICELLRAGACGYVLKSDSGSQLLAAIDLLAVRQPFFTGKVWDLLLATFLARSQPEAFRLNDHQRDVVRLVAKGHTNDEIADSLNIHVRDVELEIARIMRKLDALSITDVVPYAVRNGLVEPRAAALPWLVRRRW